MSELFSPLSRRGFICKCCAGLAFTSLYVSAAETPTSVLPAIAPNLRLLPPNSVRLSGSIDDKIRQEILYAFDEKTLATMVDVFRKRANGFADGEFWGKTVRALCHYYEYNGDPSLKAKLERTVADLISTQTADGCISGQSYQHQPKGSDLWERKYAMLGLLSYYKISQDSNVLEALIRMADYTLSQVGPPPKTRIVDTGWAFNGIESSSILEPMVWLYRITGYVRYLDFAKYIVEIEGGCKRGSIFEAILQGQDLKDIGSNGHANQSNAKAYESTSCFEGLLEYFETTGNEHWEEALQRFYKNAQAKEITIVGSGSGLGNLNKGPAPTEQWNYSALYQTNPVIDGMEGCESARWMGYCRRLLCLTGDSTIADSIELTMYNALLASIRPDGRAVDYHIRLKGSKPTPINYAKLFNGQKITCCFYNVIDALAVFPQSAIMVNNRGPVVNFYMPCKATLKLPSGGATIALEMATDYPRSDEVTLVVRTGSSVVFDLQLRIPLWSVNTEVIVNGEAIAATPGSYLHIERTWISGDEVRLKLDLRCKLEVPPTGCPKSGEDFRALKRGPIVLAQDARLGHDLDGSLDLKADKDGYVELDTEEVTIPARMQFSVPLLGGGRFSVIDFASAGNTWDETSRYRTWFPVTPPSA